MKSVEYETNNRKTLFRVLADTARGIVHSIFGLLLRKYVLRIVKTNYSSPRARKIIRISKGVFHAVAKSLVSSLRTRFVRCPGLAVSYFVINLSDFRYFREPENLNVITVRNYGDFERGGANGRFSMVEYV